MSQASPQAQQHLGLGQNEGSDSLYWNRKEGDSSKGFVCKPKNQNLGRVLHAPEMSKNNGDVVKPAGRDREGELKASRGIL